jgi:hypothetical protein
MEASSDYDALDACRVFEFALRACSPADATVAVSAAMVVIENAARSSEFEEEDAMYWQTSPVVDEVRIQQRMSSCLSHAPTIDDRAIEELRALARRTT